MQTYFYPRSPCGERRRGHVWVPRHCHFYPRSPCGERHSLNLPSKPIERFLSTLSLRRATGAVRELQCVLGNFYPRSPCGERRHILIPLQWTTSFLSTLSLRRATILPAWISSKITYFYPRSPCGERRCCGPYLLGDHHISIHALLAESDAKVRDVVASRYHISIHALLAESDPTICNGILPTR